MTDLTDDDEALLSRFRDWLRDARAESDGSNGDRLPPSDGSEPPPEVGLYRLVAEFTALRHELKLETKGSRSLQEQVETLLPTLRQAIDQFRSIGPKEDQAAWLAARPLAEALADLDEALDRGRIEIEKARNRSDAEAVALVATIDAELEAHFQGHSWLRRLQLRRYHQQVRDLVRRRVSETRPGFFDALLEGYGLIQARLQRAMDAGQIRRINSVGLPVDPERMTVIEVVDAPEQTPGTVVDEVRRGYTWQSRVLRYAEVRAARGQSLAIVDTENEDEAKDDEDAEDDELDDAE